jgi:hypothetical protein
MGHGEDRALVPEQRHRPPRRVPAYAVRLDQRAFRGDRVKVLEVAVLDPPTHDARELDIERFVRIRVNGVIRHESKVADVDHVLTRTYVTNVAYVPNVG